MVSRYPGWMNIFGNAGQFQFPYYIPTCHENPREIIKMSLFSSDVFPSSGNAYLYLHRLQGEVAGGLEGFGSCCVPVGGDGSEPPHAHQDVGGQTPHVLPNVNQIRNPELPDQILCLHCLATSGSSSQKKIQESGEWKKQKEDIV